MSEHRAFRDELALLLKARFPLLYIESFEEGRVLAEIRAGLKPFIRQLRREVTDEDITRLTEIRIKRISAYNRFQADEAGRRQLRVVVQPMIGRRVEDRVDPAQRADELGVDPGLVMDDEHVQRDDEQRLEARQHAQPPLTRRRAVGEEDLDPGDPAAQPEQPLHVLGEVDRLVHGPGRKTRHFSILTATPMPRNLAGETASYRHERNTLRFSA